MEAEPFCYGVAILIGVLMWMLTWGTPEHINRSRRPPTHPPGYKNIKRRK